MKRFSVIIALCLTILLAAGEVLAQVRASDMQLGTEYFRQREYEKALEIFERLHEDNPSQVTYHYYYSCLMELNDFKKAERVARQQMRDNPNSLRYKIDLGNVYMSSGDVSKGKRQYDDVIKNLEANHRIINEAANAFMVRRENEYAIKTYERGRELLAGSYMFHMELGNLYDRLGDFENMVTEYLGHLRTGDANVGQIQTRFQQALATDSEGKRNQFLRTALLRNIQQHPDVIDYSEMMLWLSIQQEDFESAYTQAVALDRRFNEAGDRVYSIAQLSLSNKEYDVAIRSYDYLIAKGEMSRYYLISRIEALNARYQKLTSRFPVSQEELEKLEKKYHTTLEELGKNRFTIALMRDFANLYAFMLYDTDKAIALLTEALQIGGIGQRNMAECKLDLADILLFTGDVWEATLLYSQVEKEFPNEPIGHEAKFRNARLSFYIGEFAWARAQLNVLRAATSKLIANDAMALSLLIKDNMDPDSTYEALSYFATAELHSYRNRDDLALLVLDTLTDKFPYHSIHDDVLFKKAEISIRQLEFTEAGNHLQQIVNQYPDGLVADKALFRLAEVYEIYLNDPEKAMEYYKELMLKYPASLKAAPARQRFRALRGDVV
jgi:tetratricopeptide (TPR) repeat protein